MPPKKKDAALLDDPGYKAMKAFKKAYEAANLAAGIEPLALNLDPGEDHTCIARLVISPLVRTTPSGAHECAPPHIKALMEALTPYPYMRKLSFWAVGVRGEGVPALAQYVAANRTLRVLELSDCNLTPTACKLLGEALQVVGAPKDLAMLKLDHNPEIGNAGAEALVESGQVLCVKDLNLSYCGIAGAEGGTRLANGLLRQPGLTALDLRGNRLGPEGVLGVLEVRGMRTAVAHLIQSLRRSRRGAVGRRLSHALRAAAARCRARGRAPASSTSTSRTRQPQSKATS